MTKISDLTALTGAGVDTAADLVPVVDMSETGAARNKKMTLAEFLIGLGIAETVDDRVAALLTAGTNITLTYNDGAGTLTIDAAATSGGITDFNEAVDDRVAALIVAGAGVTKSYNDAAGTLTLTAAAAAIEVQDEGATETASLVSLNFTGSAVIATDDGSGNVEVAVDAKSPAPSIQSVTSSATVTPTFSDDMVKITAQAAGLTLANPTGTAVPGWGMAIRIKDNGTARSISYGTQYRAIGVTLPTTTVISKTLYLGLVYNSDDTKWDVVAVAQEA